MELVPKGEKAKRKRQKKGSTWGGKPVDCKYTRSESPIHSGVSLRWTPEVEEESCVSGVLLLFGPGDLPLGEKLAPKGLDCPLRSSGLDREEKRIPLRGTVGRGLEMKYFRLLGLLLGKPL